MLDERDLVSRMQRGDQRAFDEFFGIFAPRLNSFAVRRSSLDAGAIEDVVQMTMINAMRNLASYRGGAALFTWLCRICRNQLADARRNAARPKAQSLEVLATSGRSPPSSSSLITAIHSMSATKDSARGEVRRVSTPARPLCAHPGVALRRRALGSRNRVHAEDVGRRRRLAARACRQASKSAVGRHPQEVRRDGGQTACCARACRVKPLSPEAVSRIRAVAESEWRANLVERRPRRWLPYAAAAILLALMSAEAACRGESEDWQPAARL